MKTYAINLENLEQGEAVKVNRRHHHHSHKIQGHVHKWGVLRPEDNSKIGTC